MFAQIAVEAKGAILLSLHQAFALQKINQEDRGVATIAAAERQSAVPKIGQLSDLTSAGRNDLGRPTYIGVAHGDRPAAMVAPRLGLETGEVCIPCDVNARSGIAGRRQYGANLRLVTLEQHDLNGQVRLLVKVASHAFPDHDHLWIVSHSTYPDCSAHDLLSRFNVLRPGAITRRWVILSERDPVLLCAWVLEERHSQNRPCDEFP
jgi:hypothetical protein